MSWRWLLWLCRRLAFAAQHNGATLLAIPKRKVTSYTIVMSLMSSDFKSVELGIDDMGRAAPGISL